MAELLYRLKKWLTVPDAAAHLSIAFGEEVTEADVLRLGLDGHLTLSVNNGCLFRCPTADGNPGPTHRGRRRRAICAAPR